MCPWVIWQLQSPCLVVASFILLPSFICVHISQLGRVVFLALAYRWGYRCLEFIQWSIGVTLYCCCYSLLVFYCLLLCSDAFWARIVSRNDSGICVVCLSMTLGGRSLCVYATKLPNKEKFELLIQLKVAYYLIILQYHKCIYSWVQRVINSFMSN